MTLIGGIVAREEGRPRCTRGRRAGSRDTTMSTNASRPDKTDGTTRPTADSRRTVRNSLEQAIRGPDAQCGNPPAAVIAYAQRHTTAAFPDVTATLQRLVDRGDVARNDDRLEWQGDR